jgi:hypothetical protein
MMMKTVFLILLVVGLSSLQYGMARKGIYDDEAREEQRLERQRAKAEKTESRLTAPATGIAGGVKQVTVDSTKGFITETAQATAEEAPVKGTVEGVSRGTERILDNTLKGAVKVATFGYGELKNYEVEEPPSGSGETTKIKIKIPGT